MKDKGSPPDDLSLWQYAMRDVKRLFGQETNGPVPATRISTPEKGRISRFEETEFGLKAPLASPVIPGPGLDRRTEDKFRKGRMPIEARLDLHGLTQREAHPAVREFIRLQHASGKRCVLIITGKGIKNEGLLRSNLRHWLDAPDLAPLILSVAPAQRQHGGGGAFYILLRRQR